MSKLLVEYSGFPIKTEVTSQSAQMPNGISRVSLRSEFASVYFDKTTFFEDSEIIGGRVVVFRGAPYTAVLNGKRVTVSFEP